MKVLSEAEASVAFAGLYYMMNETGLRHLMSESVLAELDALADEIKARADELKDDPTQEDAPSIVARVLRDLHAERARANVEGRVQ